MLIETSLHESYQAQRWGLREAVREIVSNAFDGEARHASSGKGQMEIKYSPRSKVLKVSNADITVPTKALLMGTSEARYEDEAIGTFGEGLPMALLVMARLGLEVVIYNGQEKWEPLLHQSEAYGEKVLAVRTRQMISERSGFSVELHGFEREEYDYLRTLFLKLDPNYDPQQAVVLWDGRKILLDPAYRGRVYNKGVYVCSHKDLWYGYDLKTDLNRDRHLISDYDLREATGYILQEAAREEAFVDLLSQRLVEAPNALEAAGYYSGMIYIDALVDRVHKKFVERFGASAIPVRDTEEAEQIGQYGRRGVVSSNLVRAMLSMRGLDGDKIRKKIDLEPVLFHNIDSLPASQRDNLDRSIRLVQSALPSWSPHIRVADFRTAEVHGYYEAEENNRITLARHVLDEFEDTLITLVHEVAHVSGTDGSLDHNETQLALMARIVRGLVDGE